MLISESLSTPIAILLNGTYSFSVNGDGEVFVCSENNKFQYTLSNGQSCTFTVNNEYVYFCPIGGNATKIQLEQKSYSTSFTNSTRSPETLTIPWEYDGGAFCWEGYIIPGQVRSSLNSWIPLIRAGKGSDYIEIGYRGDRVDKTLHAVFYQNGNWRESSGVNINFAPDDVLFVSLSFDGVTARFGVAKVGQTMQFVSFTPTTPNSGSYTIKLNPNAIGTWKFDDLRISSRARTDEEIAAAYASGQLELDEDTTYLLTFNGSIYPVEQVWVPLGTFWSLDWDSPDDTLEATVVARDRLELLRKSTYQPGQVQQNVSLYTLAEQVLQDAGLEPGEYAIDPALQSIIVPWAWLSPTSHREALRIIAEAALAVVYADRDGVVRIETLGSVPSEPVLEITADDYFPPLQAPSRQDQVANEIVVTTQPLKPADTPEEVYRSTTPISVPAGQTVTVQAKYNQPPVIEATASLDNPPAGVSVVGATYYAWGAEVSIRNTSGSNADVTLVITGKPLSVQGGEQVIVRDEASIIENGVLRYEFPANPLVQTLAQAQAIANALLASAKDPRRDIEVEWMGNPALELGDRVTVVGQDVYVIRQEITWDGALGARLTGRKVT